MKPIAIFFHGLFFRGAPPVLLDPAIEIIRKQMLILATNGLLGAAEHFTVGLNGGKETREVANLLIPSKARVVLHGLESQAENLTLVEIEKWVPTHPGWNVLYFHAKGATHKPGPVQEHRAIWRECMMRQLVHQWRRCVADLETFDSVGCHWMTGEQTPPGQSLWAGNFWWATSDFLQTLPSIYERDRIKQSGIAAIESRYESEVWIGNGPRLPKIRDYHGPKWDPSKIATCRNI